MFKRRLNRRNGYNNSSTRSMNNDASGSENSSDQGGHVDNSYQLKPIIRKEQSSSVDVDNSNKYSRSLTDADSSSRNNDEYYNNNSTQQQQGNKKPIRSVSFTDVHIREFERILGDNPSCSSGAPISIGWGFGNEKLLGIDNYEDSKHFGARRHNRSLLLTRQAREELLLEWGTSFHDIIDAIRTNVKVKNQRRRTVNAIGTYDRWEEVMENASRKIKRTLLLKKKDDVAPVIPKKIGKKFDDKHDDHYGRDRQNAKQVIRKAGRDSPEVETTLIIESGSPAGSRNSKLSDSSSKQIDRFSAHSGASPLNKNNRFSHNNPSIGTSVGNTQNIAPIAEIHVASNHQHQQQQQHNHQQHYLHQAPGVDHYPNVIIAADDFFQNDNYDNFRVTQYDDDVDEDITIGSHDFLPDNNNNNNKHPFDPQYQQHVSNNFFLRALEDPRFVSAMDDQAIYDEEEIDGLTACTPMSEFTYPVENDDDDDDDDDDNNNNDDEFEELDRDSSYWEIRSSGQDYAAITRKVHPVIISESDDEHYVQNRWAINTYNKD